MMEWGTATQWMMVDYSIVEVVEEVKGDAAYAVDGAVYRTLRLIAIYFLKFSITI